MAGVPELRKIISETIFNLYSRRYKPESEITITSGATEALFSAITAVVSPGDEVIIFEPAYDSYVPVVELNGGKPVLYLLIKRNFLLTGKELKIL
jgi:methionine aminotransferase